MAKIKFNLNFGGEQVRTLDDLRENFSIEDVLRDYRSGTLVRWLDSRSYTNELEQVMAITATDDVEALVELGRIFSVDTDPSEIRDILNYIENHKNKTTEHESDMPMEKNTSLSNEVEPNIGDKIRTTSKQSTSISTSSLQGHPFLVNIDWTDLGFLPKKGIRAKCASDGTRWLFWLWEYDIDKGHFSILDEEHKLKTVPLSIPEPSEDGSSWCQDEKWCSFLKYENSTWLLGRKDALWISYDLESWKAVSWPWRWGTDDDCGRVNDIIFSGGQWILVGEKYTRATREEGWIFKSSVNFSYTRSQFFRAKELGDNWEFWEKASVPSGINIKGHAAFNNGTAVAAFGYDSSYVKYILGRTILFDIVSYTDLEEHVSFLSDNGWKTFEHPDGETESLNFYFDNFWAWKDMLIANGRMGFYVSKDAQNWERTFDIDTSVTIHHFRPFALGDMIVFVGSEKIYVSADARKYFKMPLGREGKGSWEVLAGNGRDSLLAIYHNEHDYDEQSLCLGRLSIQAV